MPCNSEVGSGALPVETVPSLAIAVTPSAARASQRLLGTLAAALRRLPMPVIGRIENGALVMDLRCLEDADAFIANFTTLTLAEPTP